MKFSRTTFTHPAKNHRSAFTLAEVLAALALMAIVIPVAVAGIQVASRAGQVGVRKAAAARIADRVLNELEVTGQIYNGSQSGVVEEGRQEFKWSLQSQAWTEGNLNVATVSVEYQVQGRDYDVRLSTLFDPNTITNFNQSTTSTQ